MACPRCDEPRIGPFCEQCGHSYSNTGFSWRAVIAHDRDYFEARGEHIGRFTFPASTSPWSVQLMGASVLIGRRSAARGITPDIDLANPPADPGVSREHARLLALPDGSWALIDEGSMNGTYFNGDVKPIPAHQQVRLADGDRIHLGVWTTITMHRNA